MASNPFEPEKMSVMSDDSRATFLAPGNVSSNQSVISLTESTGQLDSSRQPVYVVLPNNQRLLLSIPRNAKVQDLQFAALRRAARFGIQATLADTVIRTTGPRAAVLFGEDSLADFMAETENTTFSLDITGSVASPVPSEMSWTAVGSPSIAGPSTTHLPGPCSAPNFTENHVFVRWISPSDALAHGKLSHIAVDPAPFEKGTTLDEFYKAAVERLCNGKPKDSCTMATALKMWTRESTFEAKGSPVTLGELGLAGTVKEPLDIFIQYVGSKERTSITQVTDLVSPQAIWDFNTTPRGLSTFATCLMVVIDHVKKQNQRGRLLNRFYDVVLEVTNFPPVLLALKTLYNSGIEHYPDVGSLLLLVADVINCLCQVMVPAWVCGSAETKLEGSRQVIAWLHGLCFAAGVNEDVPEYLHPFQCVKDTTTQENPDASKLVDFDEFMTIEIPESPEPPVTIDGPGAGPSATQKMIVAAQNPYDGLLSRLALLKVHKNYLERYGYYFKAPVPWKEFLERPALQRPDPADFDTLLADANLHAPFRMIDPMKIGQCLSAELPVVTLSAKGFVSKYDQIDIGCGERHFYQWNLLEKRISLSRMDPGQYISQQLESVIRERKKAGSWEVDAWAEWSAKANHGDPDESIVICVDSSGSMASSMSVSWNSAYADGRGGSPTSRLVEVKEFFHQFSTRLSSYGLNTSVGLVTFSCQSSVRVLQPLTMLQLDFRERLANVQPELLTAIFDAINVAKDMLVEQRKRFPRTRCRIILLTDGDDNNSTVDRLELCRELVEHEIVLDSIVIGTEMTRELFKMSRATGGYAFCPPTQAVFFQIFLLETLVDIRTRPDIERIMPEPGCWSLFQPKQADMRDPYSFPPCRPHANQDDYFISLSDAPKFMKKLPPSGDGSRSSTASPHGTDNDDPASTRSETALTASTTTRTPTTASSASGPRILMNEIRAMVDNPHDFIDVYVSQSNIGFWKVVIQGPPDSPYENGNFLLYVDIVPDFPRVPPAVRFITPILHPNISKHGRVCHPIFDREWNSRIHVYEVLQNIYGILMTLESRDAIDLIATLKFYTDPEDGKRQVANYVQRFASRSRARLRADILGDDVSTVASTVSSMTTSSSATATPSSSSTASAKRLPSSKDAKVQDSRAPALRPGSGTISSFLRSARSGNSLTSWVSVPSGRNTATVSSRPPPLLKGSGAAGGGRGAGQLTSANLAAATGGPPSAEGNCVSGAGAAGNGGERIRRRASFFAGLAKKGNSASSKVSKDTSS